MIQSTLLDSLHAIQLTIWRSVLTSIVASAIVSAATCAAIAQLYMIEFRSGMHEVHRRIDAMIEDNATKTSRIHAGPNGGIGWRKTNTGTDSDNL